MLVDHPDLEMKLLIQLMLCAAAGPDRRLLAYADKSGTMVADASQLGGDLALDGRAGVQLQLTQVHPA